MHISVAQTFCSNGLHAVVVVVIVGIVYGVEMYNEQKCPFFVALNPKTLAEKLYA